MGLVAEDLRFRGRGPYSLRIDPGECVGLAGPSGAGKTLLLRALVDLEPHTGVVRLGGTVQDWIPAPQWRCMVAMLPAESSWWGDLVADHFRDFSALDATLLAHLGFAGDVGGWQVSRLSTGEKQRLAIVRLLEIRPRALLLDEPTASLDQENIRKVERLLLDYARAQQAPLLWVSHDPRQLARVAGRILFMNQQGQLVQEAQS